MDSTNSRHDTSAEDEGAAVPSKDARAAGAEQSITLGIIRLIERALLIIVVIMTVGAVAFEMYTVYLAERIRLADILLMFLYLEVIGMVAVFYSDRRSALVYPIFIAITALARLIVLQGKDMAPEKILFEALAILILAIASITLIRLRND